MEPVDHSAFTRQREEQERATQKSRNDLAAQREKWDDASRQRGQGGPPSCFPPGTSVLTPHGERPVEQLRVGDSVTSWSSAEQCWSTSRVLKTLQYGGGPLVGIRLDDERVLSSTAPHSYFTARGLVQARHLRVGDLVQVNTGSPDATFLPVTAVTHGEVCEEVYNLVTERQYNYVAEGVLVHNFTHLRAFRMWWWNLRVGAGNFLNADRLRNRAKRGTRDAVTGATLS